MSIVVDFPAPFGPSSATVSPAEIVTSMPRTAGTTPFGRPVRLAERGQFDPARRSRPWPRSRPSRACVSRGHASTLPNRCGLGAREPDEELVERHFLPTAQPILLKTTRGAVALPSRCLAPDMAETAQLCRWYLGRRPERTWPAAHRCTWAGLGNSGAGHRCTWAGLRNRARPPERTWPVAHRCTCAAVARASQCVPPGRAVPRQARKGQGRSVDGNRRQGNCKSFSSAVTTTHDLRQLARDHLWLHPSFAASVIAFRSIASLKYRLRNASFATAALMPASCIATFTNAASFCISWMLST